MSEKQPPKANKTFKTSSSWKIPGVGEYSDDADVEKMAMLMMEANQQEKSDYAFRELHLRYALRFSMVGCALAGWYMFLRFKFGKGF